MALLRLSVRAGVMALAASWFAACGQAGADPSVTSGLAAPRGWKTLPEMASAVAAAAKGNGVTVDGAEAWGEPSRGCYAVWLALRGEGASAEQVLAGIGAQPWTTTNLVKPDTTDGLVALTFETRSPTADAAPTGEPSGHAAGSAAGSASPPVIRTTGTHRGRLRARIAAGKVTALACFANEREPVACETPCTTLLGGVP